MTNLTAIRTGDLETIGIKTGHDHQIYTNVSQIGSNIHYVGVSNVCDSPRRSAAASTWLAVAPATGVRFDSYILETSVNGMTAGLNIC
jgi:hypothetical protein